MIVETKFKDQLANFVLVWVLEQLKMKNFAEATFKLINFPSSHINKSGKSLRIWCTIDLKKKAVVEPKLKNKTYGLTRTKIDTNPLLTCHQVTKRIKRLQRT